MAAKNINPYAPPTADVAPEISASGSFDQPPPSGAARATVVGLAVCAVLSLAAIWADLGQVSLLKEALVGPISMEAAEANDNLMQLIAIVLLIALIGTMITFGVWLVRANRTARSMAPGVVDISPGWSVGWYFIPFANFVKPYQAMGQIHDASVQWDPQRFRDRPLTMPLWWTAWLATTILGQVSSRMGKSAVSDIDQLILATQVEIGADISRLTAALLAIAVVLTITRAQEQGWATRAR